MGTISSSEYDWDQMSNVTVIFRTVAGLETGGGHLMRCTALGYALKDKGCDVEFSVNKKAPNFVPLVKEFSYREESQQEFLSTVRTGKRDHNVLIVDDYGWNMDNDKECRQAFPHMVALDDLANRRRDVDLLIDSNLNREVQHYRHLLPNTSIILTGTKYAMLRPEFRTERCSALKLRAGMKGLKTILLTLGLGNNVTPLNDVMQALRDLPKNIAIHVVSGQTGTLDTIQRDKRFRFYGYVTDMVSLMKKADVCIGAGGSSSWERCCLGLPSIQIVLAENQQFIAQQLEYAGATITLDYKATGFSKCLNKVLSRLIHEPNELRQMSLAAAAVCDGAGADRSATAIIKLTKPSQRLIHHG